MSSLSSELADRGRAVRAQLDRLEDEYGPMPVPIVRHRDDCPGVGCDCEDECRVRRFVSWVDALSRYEPEAIADGVSELLRTWQRYGRSWPDLNDLVKLIPSRPPDPAEWEQWERVMRAALYGETDLLDERLLAAIGGARSLPIIADRLSSDVERPGSGMAAFRTFAARLRQIPALPPAPTRRALPPNVRLLSEAVGRSTRRPRRTMAQRLGDVLDDTAIVIQASRPEGWGDEQRRRLDELFGAGATE